MTKKRKKEKTLRSWLSVELRRIKKLRFWLAIVAILAIIVWLVVAFQARTVRCRKSVGAIFIVDAQGLLDRQIVGLDGFRIEPSEGVLAPHWRNSAQYDYKVCRRQPALISWDTRVPIEAYPGELVGLVTFRENPDAPLEVGIYHYATGETVPTGIVVPK